MTAILALVEAYGSRSPTGVARLLEEADPGEAAAVLEQLDPDVAASVLRAMALPTAASLVPRLPPSAAAAVVTALGSHAAAALLRRSSADARQPVLAALSESTRRELTRLLASRPGTAGALADPSAIALRDTHCVADGLAQMAAHPAQAGDLWLVDGDGRLTGVVPLGDLLGHPPNVGLAKLRQRPPTPVPATAEREEIADHPGWQHHATLPVVDHRGTLLGQLRATALSGAASAQSSGSSRAAKRTGRALAELYGLGLSGLVEWASEAARGGEAQRRRTP